MNYLAHLHLGGQRPGQLLGSLYGQDVVKVIIWFSIALGTIAVSIGGPALIFMKLFGK